MGQQCFIKRINLDSAEQGLTLKVTIPTEADKIYFLQIYLYLKYLKLAQEKSVFRWTDHLNMIIAVDWDVKLQPNKQRTVSMFFWVPTTYVLVEK